jgi:hypothetical protein
MYCVCCRRVVEILAGSLDAGIAVDEPEEVDQLQPQIENVSVSSALLDGMAARSIRISRSLIPAENGSLVTRLLLFASVLRSLARAAATLRTTDRLAPRRLGRGQATLGEPCKRLNRRSAGVPRSRVSPCGVSCWINAAISAGLYGFAT